MAEEFLCERMHAYTLTHRRRDLRPFTLELPRLRLTSAFKALLGVVGAQGL